jgi:hypothetical protein
MVEAEQGGSKWLRHVPLEAINGKLQLAATVLLSSFLLPVRARDPRNRDAREPQLFISLYFLIIWICSSALCNLGEMKSVERGGSRASRGSKQARWEVICTVDAARVGRYMPAGMTARHGRRNWGRWHRYCYCCCTAAIMG